MKTTKIFQYTVVFEPAEEGGYVASVPTLPGCMSQGETYEEARRNIHEAIEGFLLVLAEHNEEIPCESTERIVSTVIAQIPVLI